MQHIGLAAVLTALVPVIAGAQVYPDRPVRLIVPFPPGGTADIAARVVSDRMGQELGVPVVVENKAGGAGGSVGTLEIARAAPDGYTMGIATVGTMGTSPAVTPGLRYDPLKDFSYIGNLAAMPMLLAAGPSVQQQDMASFLEYVRSHPGQLSYGTGGVGGVAHLMGELFVAAAGTEMMHVPYRGASPALNDVASGQVDVIFDALASSSAFLDGQRIRPLAVSGDKRLPAFPDVPTFAEVGLPDVSTQAWYGLVAPAGIPDVARDKLSDAARRALARSDVRERLKQLNAEPVANTPEEFRSQVAAELEKWRGIAESRGIVLQ